MAFETVSSSCHGEGVDDISQASFTNKRECSRLGDKLRNVQVRNAIHNTLYLLQDPVGRRTLMFDVGDIFSGGRVLTTTSSVLQARTSIACSLISPFIVFHPCASRSCRQREVAKALGIIYVVET